MQLLYMVFIEPFAQMAQAPDLLVQTLWEGLVSGTLYALIALGFVLIFKAGSPAGSVSEGLCAALVRRGQGQSMSDRKSKPERSEEVLDQAICNQVDDGPVMTYKAGQDSPSCPGTATAPGPMPTRRNRPSSSRCSSWTRTRRT